MRILPILPYEQGNLDGFCGFYTIINAIALATARAWENDIRLGKLRRHIARRRMDQLFAALTTETPSLRRLTGWAVTDGLHGADLTALLKIADKWLQTNYDVRLRIHRPFYQFADMSQTQLATLLEMTALQGATAVIAAGVIPWNHWSVIMGTNKRGLKLFDSARNPMVTWKKWPKGKAPYFELLNPRSVIVIRLSPI